jgi:hypothetical protein
MQLENIEKRLINAKFHHLSEDELYLYYEQKLETISQERASAHLKLCHICVIRLRFIEEERAALDNQETTAEDILLIKRVMQDLRLQPQSADSVITVAMTGFTLTESLAQHLKLAVASWQAHFIQYTPVRATVNPGDLVWQWQSEDGGLKVYAILEKNADLTIHFSSSELSLEGLRFNVRLGQASSEVTLRRISEIEVYGKIGISRRKRPRNLVDIAIEIA